MPDKTTQHETDTVMADTDDTPDDLDETADDSELLVDENAFGIWVNWYDAEEVEYSQSADKFAPRIIVFRSAVQSYVQREPLGKNVVLVDFGTGVYLEVGQGDEATGLIGWVRGLRAYLLEGDWKTFAVISFGGRWVTLDSEAAMPDKIGNVRVVSLGPSEPLRKVMAADAMAHADENTGEVGWGSGLFLDEEALEPLSLSLKNVPTALYIGGWCFYRVGA